MEWVVGIVWNSQESPLVETNPMIAGNMTKQPDPCPGQGGAALEGIIFQLYFGNNGMNRRRE